ncbi:GGDEF domain-containing protein [Leptospira wolffii]|uniref:putative bifunctional diguanylate cyclase/phosphodiesterase n=1 Tax=Leptospira wolffii TaxID=409998 RepID=UPI0010842965|nr:GGDEF domain-containing phosphodiesterase [Leptospira wolffii]TGK56224.1 GGDEF domain-containing protein [Leptospira wolffii]TGK72271.1 GGDEF domain-containing protein [Leptospira wolffii]TGK72823.1 GGDEF domain-containing protein [Leptospira wolffii]TGL27848.1 GGDEF domain-containing protein [Leptospira wolffii]
MNLSGLNFYSYLSRIRLLKSYSSKIMMVAFLGTHVPLISLLLFFVISTAEDFETALRILGLALAATLIGTFATLLALHKLLAPVVLTSKSLNRYLAERELPDLPVVYRDEAGSLMADTVTTVRKLDELIHYMANYDGLSGLPNRELFIEKLNACLSELGSVEDPLSFPIFSLEVTHIKQIRSNFGLHMGDLYLRGLAQKLENLLGPETVIARTGDGEFSFFPISSSSQVQESDSEKWAEKIEKTAAAQIPVVDQNIASDIRIGISVFPFDGKSSDQLLWKSETALNQAKQSGNAKIQTYSSEWKERMKEKYLLEKDLRLSIQKNQLFLHYQPRMELSSGKMVSAEALLRWNHPELGIVSPTIFIPIAEESGFISEMGEWVLQKSLEDLGNWKKEGKSPLRISVNLSAKQLEDPTITKKVLAGLEKNSLEASDIELEITESSLITNMNSALEILSELHSWGVALALDDFGTGYSSLSYLSKIPLRTLKVDQSFVRKILTDPSSLAISKTIIALGKSLRLRITAEGVETEEQLRKIKDLGCDEAQGFYYSRPISLEELSQFQSK